VELFGNGDMKQQVIVTGATGFLGEELVRFLHEKNWKILALGRNKKKLLSLNQLGIQTQTVSLENFNPEITDFKHIDIVFHCAAFSSAWGSEKDFEKVNVRGTQNVVEWCNRHAVKRLVYISSTSVYFDFTDSVNIDERKKLPEHFVNAYARSKYCAEQAIKNSATVNLETVVLRPRGIIGKGDSAILPRVLKVMRKGWFPLLKKGDALVDLTHVKNVVQAVYLASIAQDVSGGIFNISNQEPLSVRELLIRIIKHLPIKVKLLHLNYSMILLIAKMLEYFASRFNLKEPLLTVYGIGLLSYSQTLNINQAKERLGYIPNICDYSIDEAIKSYFDED